MSDTFGDKFKKAFKIGGKDKDAGDESPLAHGAHGANVGVKEHATDTPATPTSAPRAAEKTTGTTTDSAKEAVSSATKAGTGATTANGAAADATKDDGHRGIMDKVKEAMGGAPWQDHHDKTLEALGHAKKAHHYAMQAQVSLKSAQEAQKKAEAAMRQHKELTSELEKHQSGQGDLATHKKNWDDAKTALAGHQKAHDHHAKLAQDTQNAAIAKEMEAQKLKPNDEEHTEALGPLEAEASRLAKTRGEAEARREALLKELHELEAKLKPMREEEALAHKKLNDHKNRGETNKQAHAAAVAEAAELRKKADLANKDLEPHAAKLKEHNALLARHESNYNKTQEQSKMAEGRLPSLKQQAAQAEKEAQEAQKQAQKHSDEFEKLKRQAEAEDAKKAELWDQARKAGHLEQDGADKQDLHKFADRLHTVLRNPIDTSLLGKNPLTGSKDGASATGTSAAHPTTPERGDITTAKPANGAATAPKTGVTGSREE